MKRKERIQNQYDMLLWRSTRGTGMFGRRDLLTLTLLAATATGMAVATASAQSFPSRPMTLVVPFGVGSGSDLVARILGARMSELLGQTVVIENVSGAGGMTAAARVAHSPPDGYQFVLGSVDTFAINQTLYKKPLYNAATDFSPIGLVTDQAMVLIARKDFPANDMKEFAAYVRANAETLNMAHAGVGSITHFTCLLFNSILGVKPTMVPFNGAAPAISALIGGQVDYMCNVTPDVVQHVRGGAFKAYAIGTSNRNAALPDVPTSKEAGLPQFQASAWNALFAPKGTPKPVLDKLSDALEKAIDDETTRKRLLDLGSEIPDKSRRGQQALAALVKDEIARWTPIIKAAAVKSE